MMHTCRVIRVRDLRDNEQIAKFFFCFTERNTSLIEFSMICSEPDNLSYSYFSLYTCCGHEVTEVFRWDYNNDK